MPHKKTKGGRSTVSTYAANHPNGGKDRPSLGSGMAEEAAKDLETRETRIDKAVKEATGGKKNKKNGPNY